MKKSMPSGEWILIDSEGFRPNVGIIICNDERRLFWGRRVGQDAWQFPQGGIKSKESPEDAMYRELMEETGLPVVIADDPMTCVARGGGKVLDLHDRVGQLAGGKYG